MDRSNYGLIASCKVCGKPGSMAHPLSSRHRHYDCANEVLIEVLDSMANKTGKYWDHHVQGTIKYVERITGGTLVQTG